MKGNDQHRRESENGRRHRLRQQQEEEEQREQEQQQRREGDGDGDRPGRRRQQQRPEDFAEEDQDRFLNPAQSLYQKQGGPSGCTLPNFNVKEKKCCHSKASLLKRNPLFDVNKM